VAGLTAQTAAEGAYYNVKINLPDIQDEAFKSKVATDSKGLKEKAVKIGNEIRKILEKELK
jgi:glutamate formiminotransferase/formiminotetrahydrofolate cyclodeaminase